MRRTLVCGLLVTIAACANPGIVALNEDTYMLSRTDKGGIFGNAAAMKADVIAESQRFAAAKGMVAVPVQIKEQPLQVGRSFASIDYTFRLAPPGSPESRGGRFFKEPERAEIKIDETRRDETKQLPPKVDVYAELLKLDDLRKRGILSEEEFEARKRKLLAEN